MKNPTLFLQLQPMVPIHKYRITRRNGSFFSPSWRSEVNTIHRAYPNLEAMVIGFRIFWSQK